MNDYERKVSASMRERKTTHATLDLKSLDESGVFAGYASVFDVVDSQADVMMRGAFTESLQSTDRDVKLLWQHAMDEPIGVIEQLREDQHGLYMKGRLLMDVARAREAYSLLKQQVVKGLSIGYSPKRYRVDDQTGIRYVSEVDLWEVSLATFPANEAAQVTIVKQGMDMRHLSHALEHAITCLLD